MKKLCFASRNKGKIAEIQALLPHFHVLSLDDIGCTDEIPEDFDTIEANSQQKAAFVWQHFKVDCFADDSGFFIDALNGKPGVYAAHYAGLPKDDDKNNDLVLAQMENQTNRKAAFRCVITLVLNGVFHQFEGKVTGTVLHEKRGEGGFGYDSLFVPDGYTQSFAELDKNSKNKISHRAAAVHKLIDFLS